MSEEEEVDIQWGSIKEKNAKKGRVFYSSFFSEGIEYTLYDNVEVYNEPEPHIGKIVKLWEEKASGTRKVLIRWFLKLKDLDPHKEGDPKELYLAFGKGKGVLNENDLETRKIFKDLPWEENLQQGILYGKVLLLQNFDPLLTSADVRDMLKNILQGVSDAHVLPQEATTLYGQALVIFDSKLLADTAFQEMEIKCLVVVNNRRPIIASKVKEPTNCSRFPGHLALDKLKLSRSVVAEEYKRAVSTSHCSQPNTIEYEMAMEWRRLQDIIQTCRTELFEKQIKETEDLTKIFIRRES